MSVVIELPPDIEASLADQAAREGISLQQHLRHLLEQQVPARTNPATPAERAAFWRQSAQGLPRTPPLSDQAVSRETIYDARG
jgi:hypothetical protein